MPRLFPPLYCLSIQSNKAKWFLPVWYKLLRWLSFLLVALAIGYSASSFGIVEVFILLFTLAGASFNEQFQWKKNPLQLEKCWGFGFIQFSKRWTLDPSSRLICHKSHRKTFLQLETRDGLLTLDKATTESESKRLIELGLATSTWLGLPFVIQEAGH